MFQGGNTYHDFFVRVQADFLSGQQPVFGKKPFPVNPFSITSTDPIAGSSASMMLASELDTAAIPAA